MSNLFKLTGSQRHQPAVDEWLSGEPHELFCIARHWFSCIRKCGDDVQELIHDGCPVACVRDAAFAYVNVFSAHVNIGFFTGAMLDDPAQLLQGSGKRMRHIKLKPGHEISSQAVESLIIAAYQDIQCRIEQE